MVPKKRVLHQGDIFLNRHAGWLNLFLYLNKSGRYCNGVSMAKFQGKWVVKKGQYYKEDLQYDAESFPLVGHLNIQQHWEQAFLSSLAETSFFDEYDSQGHKI